MSYDIFYYDRHGRQEAIFDRETPEYSTAPRNRMLRQERGYAMAIPKGVGGPVRHWNGSAWVEGSIQPLLDRLAKES